MSAKAARENEFFVALRTWLQKLAQGQVVGTGPFVRRIGVFQHLFSLGRIPFCEQRGKQPSDERQTTVGNFGDKMHGWHKDVYNF